MTEPSQGNNLIPIEKWQELVTAFGQNNVPMPYVHEIFLIDCKVAGTGYVEGIEKKTSALEKGTLLAFMREPANQYDPLAILILNENNEKIGYVPRARNEILARLMDAGKRVFGRVEEKGVVGEWINISIKVYLLDV